MTMTRRQAVLAGCGLAATPMLYGQGRLSNPPTQLAGAAQAEVRRVNLFDYEQGARERLPHTAWEYINCGAGDEITLRWNREAFDQIRVRPQILVDVSKLDTRVTLFEQNCLSLYSLHRPHIIASSTPRGNSPQSAARELRAPRWS